MLIIDGEVLKEGGDDVDFVGNTEILASLANGIGGCYCFEEWAFLCSGCCGTKGMATDLPCAIPLECVGLRMRMKKGTSAPLARKTFWGPLRGPLHLILWYT